MSKREFVNDNIRYTVLTNEKYIKKQLDNDLKRNPYVKLQTLNTDSYIYKVKENKYILKINDYKKGYKRVIKKKIGNYVVKICYYKTGFKHTIIMDGNTIACNIKRITKSILELGSPTRS